MLPAPDRTRSQCAVLARSVHLAVAPHAFVELTVDPLAAPVARPLVVMELALVHLKRIEEEKVFVCRGSWI